jgi:hypothetical protein
MLVHRRLHDARDMAGRALVLSIQQCHDAHNMAGRAFVLSFEQAHDTQTWLAALSFWKFRKTYFTVGHAVILSIQQLPLATPWKPARRSTH